MRVRVSMVAAAGAILFAAVLVLCHRANRAPSPTSQPGERDEPEAVIPTATHAPQARAPLERPRIDIPAYRVEPRDPPPRRDFNRRPHDPSGETESQYQGRAELVTAFDAFREESGISEDKAQRILQLLYDYQENVRHLRKQHMDRIPYADPWKGKSESRKTNHTILLIDLDTLDALEELLSEDELRTWRRHMDRMSISVFAHFKWPYDPPLIMPTDPCKTDPAAGC